jgi:type II secretory pathway pseudopilin PulG
MTERKDTTKRRSTLVQRLRDQAGISMIEMVMAILIFGLTMTALLPVLMTSLDLTGSNRYRSVAANLASREMDTVRGSVFTSLPEGLVTTTKVVDGVSYTVDRESEWITQSATAGPCNGGAASGSTLAFLRVTVSVDWPTRGAIPQPVSQTIMAPPVGVYNTASGNIAAKVVDRGGLPLDSQNVSLTGPMSDSQVTPSDGCAFFAFLTAGSYSVIVNTSGYVDQQGVSNPSQSASVTNGTTSSLQFVYDLASTLSLTFVPVGLSGYIPPDNAAVTLNNTTLLPAGKKVFQGSGSPRTLAGLFPYVAGYSGWAGDCSDADPEGKNGVTPYWPGALRDTPMVVNPGATTADTLNMSALDLTVRKAGAPLAGVSVRAVHAPNAASCTAGNTLTFTGTTNASGLIKMALPFGSWQIQVVGKSPVSSWPQFSADPRVATATAVTANVT